MTGCESNYFVLNMGHISRSNIKGRIYHYFIHKYFWKRGGGKSSNSNIRSQRGKEMGKRVLELEFCNFIATSWQSIPKDKRSANKKIPRIEVV